jgi:gallate decarboxylase subunit D
MIGSFHGPAWNEFKRKVDSMKEYHVIIASESRYQIELKAIACGSDYIVTICGGSRYHVGATALGCAKMESDGLPGAKATVSVICAFGHRDDEVAGWAARYLATELKCNVSVSAGVHIDNANPDEINILMNNCVDACKNLISQILKEV